MRLVVWTYGLTAEGREAPSNEWRLENGNDLVQGRNLMQILRTSGKLRQQILRGSDSVLKF